MTWWVESAMASGGAVLVVSWAFWVIFSICLHELAHGWAAIWQGDDTPRELGRMTMNPLVHMGPASLLAFAIIGLAWGLMPTDPSRFRWRRRGRAVVALAGPAMNVALAVAALTALALVLRFEVGRGDLHANLRTFLFTGGLINIVLAAFNMLPVPPLDGSNVLAGLSFRFYRLMQHERAPMIGMFIILAVFLSGMGGLLFVGAQGVAYLYLELMGVMRAT
jgi:Zn-dependent protease